MITTEYDGCGKCLVGVRRLSRKTDATSSPERQLDQVVAAVAAIGGHIIAWADDWEVSGATDPLTRPALGPWLRGELGPYAGIAGAAVDRIGRNQRDVLNTGYMIKDSGRLMVSHGHDGPWDLDDPTDEMRFSMEAFGAQMELRAIQKRNRDAALKSRADGRPRGKTSYGYRYVRLYTGGKVDRVEIDPVAAEIIRDARRRADQRLARLAYLRVEWWQARCRAPLRHPGFTAAAVGMSPGPACGQATSRPTPLGMSAASAADPRGGTAPPT
ncbi:recombinase family protein [Streptacidiphilus anmyonensis]|uniref:recombinase family protein n=1 Tax=Streptacidiphilus anmyonensis TaxID=405782 RepID=UPI001F197CAF|nr:recombinase family protein [Streptacidiphilus anmyonensis]